MDSTKKACFFLLTSRICLILIRKLFIIWNMLPAHVLVLMGPTVTLAKKCVNLGFVAWLPSLPLLASCAQEVVLASRLGFPACPAWLPCLFGLASRAQKVVLASRLGFPGLSLNITGNFRSTPAYFFPLVCRLADRSCMCIFIWALLSCTSSWSQLQLFVESA